MISLDRLDDVLAMAVGGVDDDDIHIRLDQCLDAGEIFHARRRPDAQPAAPVFAGVRKLMQLVDVRIVISPTSRPSLSTSSSFSTLAL